MRITNNSGKNHLDGEEVHPGDHSQVRFGEGRPRILSFSLRRWLDAVLGQDTLDGGPADVVAHVVQGVAQPRVARTSPCSSGASPVVGPPGNSSKQLRSTECRPRTQSRPQSKPRVRAAP